MKFIRWFVLILVFILGGVTQAEYKILKLRDGAKLRVGSWPSQKTLTHGTIILLVGRASYMEKNQELIEDLTHQGFNVETFDWRGHGGSERLLLHTQKCHIDSFNTYLKDLEEYLETYVSPRHPGPWLLLGVSMGGHLAIRYAHDHPHQFKKVALVVPMFDMITHPFPRFIVGPLVKVASFLGFGESYAFGYKDIDLKAPLPPLSKETHDFAQHKKTHALMHAKPELVVAGPTFDWVKAAVDSIALANQAPYLEGIKLPIQIYLASDDKLVNNGVTQEKCKIIKNCTSIQYANSYHNLTKETKEIRDKFLTDLITFLKGRG